MTIVDDEENDEAILDERMPSMEEREYRLDDKYYVHLFGASWPAFYKTDWAKKAFHDTVFQAKETSDLLEGIISSCEWIRDEEIDCRLVYIIKDGRVGYSYEFDNDKDGVNAKLAFFSFF